MSRDDFRECCLGVLAGVFLILLILVLYPIALATGAARRSDSFAPTTYTWD